MNKMSATDIRLEQTQAQDTSARHMWLLRLDFGIVDEEIDIKDEKYRSTVDVLP